MPPITLILLSLAGYLSVQMLYITLMVARQTAIDRNERIAQLEQQLAQASSSSSSSSSSSGSASTFSAAVIMGDPAPPPVPVPDASPLPVLPVMDAAPLLPGTLASPDSTALQNTAEGPTDQTDQAKPVGEADQTDPFTGDFSETSGPPGSQGFSDPLNVESSGEMELEDNPDQTEPFDDTDQTLPFDSAGLTEPLNSLDETIPLSATQPGIESADNVAPSDTEALESLSETPTGVTDGDSSTGPSEPSIDSVPSAPSQSSGETDLLGASASQHQIDGTEKASDQGPASEDQAGGATSDEATLAAPKANGGETAPADDPSSDLTNSSLSETDSISGSSSATDLLPESSTDLLPGSSTDRPPESSTDLPPESSSDLSPESSTDLPPESSTGLPPESTTLHSELVTRVFAEFVSPAALAAQLEPLAEQSLTALRAGHRSPLYMQLASELQGEIESRQAVTNTEADDAQGEAERGPVETALEAPAAWQNAEEREEPEDPLLASLLQLLGGQASARTAHGPLMHRSLPEQRWWSRQRQPAWGGVRL